MKSGPILNGCTVRPRRRSAPISPSVMLVLPTPLCVPATTIALNGEVLEVGVTESTRSSRYRESTPTTLGARYSRPRADHLLVAECHGHHRGAWPPRLTRRRFR